MSHFYLEKMMREHRFILTIFSHRYGGRVCAFLTWDSEIAKDIEECFNGEDYYRHRVWEFFRPAQWYPIVEADNLVDALVELDRHLQLHTPHRDWIRAVKTIRFDPETRGDNLPGSPSAASGRPG